MTTTRADLVIVGAGLAGAAAAQVAAARGLRVVVLERFGPGHKNGSSHGSARIFRRAYPDPLYVRLAGRAGELWRRLEDRSGQSLLTLTGGLDFGASRDPERLHAVLTGCGVPAELLGEDEAGERWPQFDFTGAGRVMFHAEAGVLDPETAIAAMLRLAARDGADVRFETPVTAMAATPAGDGALVRTGSGTFTAPVAVVAAGAWIAPLLAGLVELPPLTVTEQQVFHFAPAKPPAPPAGTPVSPPVPPWPVFIGYAGGDYFYGLPGGRDGGVPGAIKLGEHVNGTVTTADTRDFRIEEEILGRVTAFAARRLPGLDVSAPLNATTCLYTWTASEDFILDRPAGGPFVVASACSGHGAKFAPLLGEILADLAAGKPPPDPRFTRAAHLGSRPGGHRGS